MRDNVRSGALTEVTFFILLALYEPRHGYGVMQFVEDKTEGRLVLGAGSLYGALNTLGKKGWIRPAKEDDERRKCYEITPQGRQIAEKELTRLRKLTALAEEIIEKPAAELRKQADGEEQCRTEEKQEQD